jgi:hypothetical protein
LPGRQAVPELPWCYPGARAWAKSRIRVPSPNISDINCDRCAVGNTGAARRFFQSVPVAGRASTSGSEIPLSFAGSSVDGGDTASAAGDGSSEAVVVLTLSASLPRLDADPLAGASAPSDVGASASSSSLAGVVVAPLPPSSVTVVVSASASPDVDEPAGVSAPPVVGTPAAVDVREPAKAPEATGGHHEHEDTSDHNYHPAGFGWWRLLWPGALVLGYGVPRETTARTNSVR